MRETHRVITIHNSSPPLYVREPEVPHHDADHHQQLLRRELLPNASMAARAKGEEVAVRPRGHESVPVIHFLLLHGLGIADALPPAGMPSVGVGEVVIAFRHRGWRGEQHVRARDHSRGAGYGEGVPDFAHDGMNGVVQAKGLVDDHFQER